MNTTKTLIVGNWKMNLNVHEASLYLHKLSETVSAHRDTEIVLAPTLLALQSLSLQIDHRTFKLAAQNFYWRDHGAYTGEVSATQLRGIVKYAIVGHSERRHIFNESDKDIRGKVQAAIRNNISPILCIGETAAERADGETNDVLHDQLVGGLANITSEELGDVVIAYEPVWAIGTGNNALPQDVQAAIRAIRSQIKHLYGDAASKNIRILYGGSVTADSAASYLATEGVNGLLIGGASLDAHAFGTIVEKAHEASGVTKK
jgi:triosephosphate isomerase (TIM)